MRVRPFIPFRLHLTGGTTFDITNPEFITVGKRIAAVFVRRDPNSPYFDEPAWVSLVHIVYAEPITEPAPAGGPQ